MGSNPIVSATHPLNKSPFPDPPCKRREFRGFSRRFRFPAGVTPSFPRRIGPSLAVRLGLSERTVGFGVNL